MFWWIHIWPRMRMWRRTSLSSIGGGSGKEEEKTLRRFPPPLSFPANKFLKEEKIDAAAPAAQSVAVAKKPLSWPIFISDRLKISLRGNSSFPNKNTKKRLRASAFYWLKYAGWWGNRAEIYFLERLFMQSFLGQMRGWLRKKSEEWGEKKYGDAAYRSILGVKWKIPLFTDIPRQHRQSTVGTKSALCASIGFPKKILSWLYTVLFSGR